MRINLISIFLSSFPCLSLLFSLTHSLSFSLSLFVDFEKLPLNIQTRVQELEESTKHCTKFLVNICLSYGGRADITTACKEISLNVLKGELKIHEITEDTINQFLTTHSLPG